MGNAPDANDKQKKTAPKEVSTIDAGGAAISGQTTVFCLTFVLEDVTVAGQELCPGGICLPGRQKSLLHRF